MSEEQKQKMWDLFLSLGQKGLTMNHYDLFNITLEYEVKDWKKFLQLPEVIEHINEEFAIIAESERKKMINGAATTNSVGRAQLLNAVSKNIEDNSVDKDGPIFIYSYVPPSKQQEAAENVQFLQYDLFDPTKEE